MQPHAGRSWLKHMVAGHLGLTFMQVGQALDILPEPAGWDATTRRGRRAFNSQVNEEGPYFAVITMPCGPWGVGMRITANFCDRHFSI